jgi:hypothetical protein
MVCGCKTIFLLLTMIVVGCELVRIERIYIAAAKFARKIILILDTYY